MERNINSKQEPYEVFQALRDTQLSNCNQPKASKLEVQHVNEPED